MLECDPTEKKHPIKVKMIDVCGGGVTDPKKDQEKNCSRNIWAGYMLSGCLQICLIENEDPGWRDGTEMFRRFEFTKFHSLRPF